MNKCQGTLAEIEDNILAPSVTVMVHVPWAAAVIKSEFEEVVAFELTHAPVRIVNGGPETTAREGYAISSVAL